MMNRSINGYSQSQFHTALMMILRDNHVSERFARPLAMSVLTHQQRNIEIQPFQREIRSVN